MGPPSEFARTAVTITVAIPRGPIVSDEGDTASVNGAPLVPDAEPQAAANRTRKRTRLEPASGFDILRHSSRRSPFVIEVKRAARRDLFPAASARRRFRRTGGDMSEGA